MNRSAVRLCAPHARHLTGFRRARANALAGILLALVLAGCATQPPPIETAVAPLPVELQTQPDEILDDTLTAIGDETYRCERVKSGVQGAVTGLDWVRAGSEATLANASRTNVGTVMPGGYFIAYDGSYVRTVIAQESQIAADAITWALFRVRTTGGHGNPRGPERGRFSQITSIQRVDTTGGMPVAYGCVIEGTRLLVPYRATYRLYRLGSPSAAAL